MNDEIRMIGSGELEARSAYPSATEFLTIVVVLALASPIILGLAGLGWRLFRHFAGW